MKKIFFVFAMLFMTIISALAEEYENCSLTWIVALDEPARQFSYDGKCFEVEGYGDVDGMFIHNGNTITIKSKGGEKITKVECVVYYGVGYDMIVNPASASVSGSISSGYSSATYTIDNVYANSLEIYSNCGANEWFQVDQMKVYYEKPDNSLPEDCILFEGFATTTGKEYLGSNIKVTGTEANANGMSIGNGKTITISPNNDNDVRIFKVDLEFSNQFNGTINSLDGSVVEGSGKNMTISNIFSPSLTISSPDGSGQISNITVYYVKMSEEKNQAFATKNGTEYIVANGRINVIGTECTGGYGLDIDGGESVTITSNYGAEISKVELHLYYHEGPDIESTVGKVTGKNKDWTISDINSSSLTISYPNYYETEEFIQIDRITVYYKEPEVNSTMEVVAKEGEGFYWTTFYSEASSYEAPENTQVYTVKLNGTKVEMTEIRDRIVNKWEGVVLKSSTENITMTKTDKNSTDSYVGNRLKGTTYKRTNPSPGNVYVLNYKESAGVAFYKLKSTGTIRANKAYLQVGSSAAAREFFTFDFDATATGVDSINAQENEENAEVKMYDLQGRRVTNPGKGIYIVNGKKVLMK